ncbi:MAG: hypothetical protein G3M78_00865 [Candidatus Nitrohelix vancouverensis]|uniref:Uncharacterized protein n=1 Tax=Candidatus Nitrohelix vancouverensis TaxID=2705534 RepID=A0A7T0C007_9BACT|nr:MAG: hypothetical protein G3M78_00865 [Candidatus Nitrohelix vancouverensis]
MKTLLAYIVMGATLLIVSDAWGMEGHHSHSMHHEMDLTHAVESPFAEKGLARTPHCVLNGHYHEGNCPHSKQSAERHGNDAISVDCGGTAPYTVPVNNSAANFPMELVALNANPQFNSSHTLDLLAKPVLGVFGIVDPPPRS